MTHALDKLSADLESCFYPGEVAFVDRGIGGFGFYPGACGYEGDRFPHGGVMLLGRDWGTSDLYRRFAGSPARDETGTTARNTRKHYQRWLEPFPVWCTNYLVGLRRSGSATGNMKKLITRETWVQYEASCWSFLQKQVIFQKPRLILVLGRDNKEDLTRSDRFGDAHEYVAQQTFSSEGQSFTTKYCFIDHPMSLTHPSVLSRAQLMVIRARELLSESEGDTYAT